MENWKGIPEHKLPGLCGTDARKWAESFQQIVVEEGVKINEALMIGWFANIIEQTKMHVRVVKSNLERLCENCDYIRRDSHNIEYSHCMHPKNSVKSMTSGRNLFHTCAFARSRDGCCTPEGNLYNER